MNSLRSGRVPESDGRWKTIYCWGRFPESAYSRVPESAVAGFLIPFTNAAGLLNPAGVRKPFTSVRGGP